MKIDKFSESAAKIDVNLLNHTLTIPPFLKFLTFKLFPQRKNVYNPNNFHFIEENLI